MHDCVRAWILHGCDWSQCAPSKGVSSAVSPKLCPRTTRRGCHGDHFNRARKEMTAWITEKRWQVVMLWSLQSKTAHWKCLFFCFFFMGYEHCGREAVVEDITAVILFKTAQMTTVFSGYIITLLQAIFQTLHHMLCSSTQPLVSANENSWGNTISKLCNNLLSDESNLLKHFNCKLWTLQ